MEWNDKTQMIRLSNVQHDSATRKEFHDFCLAQFPNFDTQAWDMFFTCIHIIPSQFKEHIIFWKDAWEYIKKIDCNDYGFRTGMRIALIQTWCEEEFNL